jgi:hypothetical protein
MLSMTWPDKHRGADDANLSENKQFPLLVDDVHGAVSSLWSILLQHAAPSCCCLLCLVMLWLHARRELNHTAVCCNANVGGAMCILSCKREESLKPVSVAVS